MSANPYESRPKNIEELAKAFETDAALHRHYRAGNERLEQAGFSPSWTRKVLISPQAREEYNRMIERGVQEFRRQPYGRLSEEMVGMFHDFDATCSGFLAGLAVPGTNELTLAYWDKDNNNAKNIELKDIKVE